jgi:HlyD family secretion protein
MPPARLLRSASPILAVLALLSLPLAGADEVAPAKVPELAEATRGPFEVLLELEGAFFPRDAVEVSYVPKLYGGVLEVVSAVGPGPVVKGQLLVAFDTEEIDRQIDGRRRDLEIAQLKFARQEEDARRAAEAAAIELAGIEIRRRQAEEELELFRAVHRPMRIEQAEFGLQGQEDRIQDEVEELQQLEKMYTADDLTEETEEIVLRRARRGLERSRRNLGFAQRRHTLFLEVALPREEEQLVLELRRQENAFAGARTKSDLALALSNAETEKARVALARQQEELRHLLADREALRIEAPVAGYAAPGAVVDGRWQKFDEMRRMLSPGNRVAVRQVLYTIVQPGNVGVVAKAAEKDLPRLKEGQDATVTAPASEGASFAAGVASVLPVGTGGKHEVVLALQATDKRIMPGQGCTVRVTVRRASDALTVPEAAVRARGEEHVVHEWVDGEAVARTVKVGATSGGRTEILDGLEAGRRVLAKAPKE